MEVARLMVFCRGLGFPLLRVERCGWAAVGGLDGAIKAAHALTGGNQVYDALGFAVFLSELEVSLFQG
jgi:hypothetical protein